MLNSTCQIEEEFVVTVFHWICLFISFPIYIIAFIVLLTKCPEHFNEYRKLLVIHIISGVLMDLHVGIIWKMVATLPWPALCSIGYASEYAVICYQVFLYLHFFTGITTVSLFIYRMKVATKHVENAPLRKIVYILRNLFLAFSAPALIFLMFTYSDLKRQKEYKMKVESKFGTFPEYMWCDNCIFMRFDSMLLLLSYILGYCALVLAFLTGGTAALETIRCLKSTTSRLSARTIAMQKNFLFSLMVGVITHITFICIPLVGFFLVNLIRIDVPYLAPVLIAMLQYHGSASTLVMLLTNNLLRKTTKELLLMPQKFFMSVPGAFTQNNSQVLVLVNNQIS